MPDITSMIKSLSLPLSWSRRPPTTLMASSSLRTEVQPPSLRCAPVLRSAGWQRLLFWLMAPSPQDRAAAPDRLPPVRTEFMATLADIDSASADRLRLRIADTRSLRDLWHLRADLYRVVGIAHSQCQAEERVALLNRHFPTRAPRSQFHTL